MTARTRHVRPVVTALTVALALGACLPADGEGSSPSSSSGGSAGSSTESFDEPHQRELTKERARSALPTLEDAPEGYLPNRSSSTAEWTFDPESCAAVELDSPSARAFHEKHRTVHEHAAFSRDGTNSYIGVWLSSHDEPYPLAYFDDAGEMLSECERYTKTDDTGFSMTTETTTLSAPHVDGADRVLAVRLKGRSANTDRLYVRSGHNRILVTQQSSSGDPFDERLLTEHAHAVIDDLKKDS